MQTLTIHLLTEDPAQQASMVADTFNCLPGVTALLCDPASYHRTVTGVQKFTVDAVTAVANECIASHPATQARTYVTIQNQLMHVANRAFETADKTREEQAVKAALAAAPVPSESVHDATDGGFEDDLIAQEEAEEEEAAGRAAEDEMGPEELGKLQTHSGLSQAEKPGLEELDQAAVGDEDWSMPEGLRSQHFPCTAAQKTDCCKSWEEP